MLYMIIHINSTRAVFYWKNLDKVKYPTSLGAGDLSFTDPMNFSPGIAVGVATLWKMAAAHAL